MPLRHKSRKILTHEVALKYRFYLDVFFRFGVFFEQHPKYAVGQSVRAFLS
jgi:hypothetical protein